MSGTELGEFAAALRERVRVAREELRVARESGDPYAVQVAVGGLDGLVRLARVNGVDIDDPGDGAADAGVA
ncbi:MAG TPA: hypothetical protein VIP77_12525 [Jiangellaceae bacterium]